jgi:hypothetical protein
MYKGVKLRKREKQQNIKLVQSRCENLSMSITDHLCRSPIFIYQKSRACNRSTVMMGGVSLKGESWEVAKPTATALRWRTFAFL